MITLLIDAVAALIKFADRAMTAVENVRRQEPPLPDADAPPAGAAPSDSAGGHPLHDTSELLAISAGFVSAYRQSIADEGHGPYLEQLEKFCCELRDRAAQFRAVGD